MRTTSPSRLTAAPSVPPSLLAAALASALVGCDWAAADGPWNEREQTPSASTDTRVHGLLCSPNGLRGVPGYPVAFADAEDLVIATTRTDAVGAFSVELPPGRFTLSAGRPDQFEAYASVQTFEESSELTLPPTCLASLSPQTLVFRASAASAQDRLPERLAGLGFDRVHEGPTEAADAGQLLASPAGLVDYGILAILDGFDPAALLAVTGALQGLDAFLDLGGILYLSAAGWPIAEALAPGALTLLPAPAAGETLEAVLLDPLLEDQLRWPSVGVPLRKDALLFASEYSVAQAELTDTSGAQVIADLWLRIPVGAGRIVLASPLAPAPRADSWWIDDPADWRLPDGSWDGRGALVDRLILEQ